MRKSITLLLGIITMLTLACSSASGDVASIERKDVAPFIVEEGDSRSLVRGEAEMVAWADCLRPQGIDVKDPTITNDGIDFEIPGIKKDPKVMTAYENCNSGIRKAGK